MYFEDQIYRLSRNRNQGKVLSNHYFDLLLLSEYTVYNETILK